jgi:hypothetical protein
MNVGRERSLINKHVRYRNREAGEHVIWYEFMPINTSGSVYDDVYNEGGPGSLGRNYKSGVLVPTIYASESEDSFRAIPDGRQVTQNSTVTILFADMERAGVSNPREYNAHLNDMYKYDGRYYKISDYRVRGRLDKEVVITVQGFEVFVDQELPFDPGPDSIFTATLPWPTSFPGVV